MKQYNGEKGIISLTSWKKRIGVAHNTLVSILKNCPEFHIVLVLSEEEFTNKEKDLPDKINELADLDCIEILWTYSNIKSYKKIMFTGEKYLNVPIISADDDIIYFNNFADILYQEWLKNEKAVVRYTSGDGNWRHAVAGPWTLYPPGFCNYMLKEFPKLNEHYIEESLDDDFNCYVIHKYNIPFTSANRGAGDMKMIAQDVGMCQHPKKWKDYE